MRRRVYLSFLMWIGILAGGCTSRPPSESKLDVVEVSFFPDHYRATRILGADFLSRTGSGITVMASKGFCRFELGGRSTEIPIPAGDSRPVLPLRLTGPGGTIQENFLVATGYNGPISIPRQDAQILGLTGSPTAEEIFLVKKDDLGAHTRLYFQAPLKVEMPELEIEDTFPVIWLPAEVENSKMSTSK